MLRRLTVGAALCALLALQGCQPPMELFLLNNTGSTIELVSSTMRWQDHTGRAYTETWRRHGLSWPFLIDDGRGRKIKPSPTNLWMFDIRAGRCYARYEAPLQNLDLWNFELQIEPDGRLYVVDAEKPLRGARSAVEDVTPFAELQSDGFPVQPISRICR